jgi:hypothetical protein
MNNLHATFEQERPKDFYDNYKPLNLLVKPSTTKPQAKGPHIGGPFITGDFCSETLAASNLKKALQDKSESIN